MDISRVASDLVKNMEPIRDIHLEDLEHIFEMALSALYQNIGFRKIDETFIRYGNTIVNVKLKETPEGYSVEYFFSTEPKQFTYNFNTKGEHD